MKLPLNKNVFEAKSVCYEFVTVHKNKKQNYEARTTIFDILRLITGLSILTWLFLDISKFTLQQNSARSILFEMQIVLISRIEAIYPLFVVINSFIYRFNFFKYLQNVHSIDLKVNLIKKSTIDNFFDIYSSQISEFIEI